MRLPARHVSTASGDGIVGTPLVRFVKPTARTERGDGTPSWMPSACRGPVEALRYDGVREDVKCRYVDQEGALASPVEQRAPTTTFAPLRLFHSDRG